jgi:hypothetical protein
LNTLSHLAATAPSTTLWSLLSVTSILLVNLGCKGDTYSILFGALSEYAGTSSVAPTANIHA